MKDKLDRFLDIINDYDLVTDEELKEILEDKDLKDVQNSISKVTDAITETHEVDIDREWKQFAKSDLKSRHIRTLLSGFFFRNAAAVIICVVASLAVVAVTIGINYSVNHHSNAQQSIIEDAEVIDNSVATGSILESSKQAPSEENIVFRNQSLDSILSAMAEYYGTTVDFKTDDSKNLRLYFLWDKSLPLEEIISQLNTFELLDITLANNVITIK